MIHTGGSALLATNLSAFIKAAWHVLEPDTEYRHNWHIEAICEHLEAVSRGDIPKLVINVPPGHMKSLTTCVFWPAWDWITKPNLTTIVASYAHDFSVRDHRKMSKLVTSDWYQSRFGGVEIVRENESKLETSRGGVRHATSTGGVGTGERVHRVIHDDLLRSNDAHSEAKRKQAEEHCKAMSTRGADPLTFTQVMIMQRLHERDPAAWAKARGWEVLSLPAEYEPSKTKTTSIGWKDPRVSDGELLWPNHFPQAVIDAAKLDLGSYAYAAQFQQSPSPLGGGIIRGEWFKRYAVLPPLKQLRIYADTAQKTQERHDYSVFQCWGQCADGKLYLVDQIRGKWESHELKRRAIDFWHKHIASTVPLRHMKIEDKASGTGLIQDLRHEGKIPVSGIGRTKDKLTRVLDVVSRIEAGFVYLPENSAFVSDFIHECEAFTNDDTHLHDDQIDPLCDAISDMLIFKQVTKISTLKI